MKQRETVHYRTHEKSKVARVEADLTGGPPLTRVRGSFVREGILSGRTVKAKVQTWKSMNISGSQRGLIRS